MYTSERMKVSPLLVHEETEPEADSKGAAGLDKSLRELRDVCFQLNHAADYCKTTFLNTKQKKVVLENTKRYICRAVVTVVDHLGSISASLDHCLSQSNFNTLPAAELRIDCLKHRVETCRQYSHGLALSKLRCLPHFPSYHPRYISPTTPDLGRSNDVLGESRSPSSGTKTERKEFKAEEEVPLFFYTYNQKPSASDLASVLPVRDDDHSILIPKGQHHPFHFQASRKLRRNLVNWKSVQKKSCEVRAIVERARSKGRAT